MKVVRILLIYFCFNWKTDKGKEGVDTYRITIIALFIDLYDWVSASLYFAITIASISICLRIGKQTVVLDRSREQMKEKIHTVFPSSHCSLICMIEFPHLSILQFKSHPSPFTCIFTYKEREGNQKIEHMIGNYLLFNQSSWIVSYRISIIALLIELYNGVSASLYFAITIASISIYLKRKEEDCEKRRLDVKQEYSI